MSVCLDFKFMSKRPNKCTSHHFRVCGVMVKLNNSHKLCCAHLWHCKPDIITLICLNCKDLWYDPFAFCVIVFFPHAWFIASFLPCIFPAVTLQMFFVFFCLICLCAIILFSYCVASCFRPLLNLFNVSLYNMIIVSLVLYISKLNYSKMCVGSSGAAQRPGAESELETWRLTAGFLLQGIDNLYCIRYTALNWSI